MNTLQTRPILPARHATVSRKTVALKTVANRSRRPTTTARLGIPNNDAIATTKSASFFANVHTLVGTFNSSVIIAASEHEESRNDGIA
jgi:hypothetical protein